MRSEIHHKELIQNIFIPYRYNVKSVDFNFTSSEIYILLEKIDRVTTVPNFALQNAGYDVIKVVEGYESVKNEHHCAYNYSSPCRHAFY